MSLDNVVQIQNSDFSNICGRICYEEAEEKRISLCNNMYVWCCFSCNDCWTNFYCDVAQTVEILRNDVFPAKRTLVTVCHAKKDSEKFSLEKLCK